MKINSLSIISVLSVLTCATVANAGVVADFYVGGMVGAGGQTLFTKDEHTSSASKLLGAIAGVDIPVFRIEAEYNYIDSSDLNTNSGMLNAYFKVPSTLIQPYIGGGIGMVFSGDQTVSTDGLKTKFDIDSTAAYQAMLGATIDILAVPLKFDVEGRVLYAPDIYKIEETNITPDLMEYNVRVKMRYIF
jgi:hypothetical protein